MVEDTASWSEKLISSSFSAASRFERLSPEELVAVASSVVVVVVVSVVVVGAESSVMVWSSACPMESINELMSSFVLKSGNSNLESIL
jgi:hypothetical protein